MTNPSGTKQELLNENSALKQRIKELEQSESERKQVEELLKQTKEFYRVMVDNANDMIWTLDIDGNFIFFNKQAEIISGYKLAERKGKTFAPLIHPDDLPTVIDVFKKTLAGTSQQYTVRFYDKNQQIVILSVNSAPIYQMNKITGTVSFGRDITERKRAEDALRESEERYRNLFDNANEAIFVAQDGKLVFINPMTVRLIGYSGEDLMSRSFVEFIHPDDRDMIIDRHVRRIKGAELPHTYSFRLIHEYGKITWVDLNTVVVNWKGKPATLNFLSDITERKRAEEERRSLQERLQHADKMEAIGTLAGGIAHDFNNLLMGVQGHASLTLLDLDPSHPHYERLKSIEEQVQSGADLTRQLLGFARGGRYDVKPADMNDIIKVTSSMFGRTKKEISIHRKYGKDLWPVEVDRGQMEQVFMNLYVNAWQAMPGGGEIYLETEDVLLDDEQAVPYAVTPGKYVKVKKVAS